MQPAILGVAEERVQNAKTGGRGGVLKTKPTMGTGGSRKERFDRRRMIFGFHYLQPKQSQSKTRSPPPVEVATGRVRMKFGGKSKRDKATKRGSRQDLQHRKLSWGAKVEAWERPIKKENLSGLDSKNKSRRKGKNSQQGMGRNSLVRNSGGKPTQ